MVRVIAPEFTLVLRSSWAIAEPRVVTGEFPVRTATCKVAYAAEHAVQRKENGDLCRLLSLVVAPKHCCGDPGLSLET